MGAYSHSHFHHCQHCLLAVVSHHVASSEDDGVVDVHEAHEDAVGAVVVAHAKGVHAEDAEDVDEHEHEHANEEAEGDTKDVENVEVEHEGAHVHDEVEEGTLSPHRRHYLSPPYENEEDVTAPASVPLKNPCVRLAASVHQGAYVEVLLVVEVVREGVVVVALCNLVSVGVVRSQGVEEVEVHDLDVQLVEVEAGTLSL